MSRAAQIMIGVSLITVPTIVYGGLTVLGVLSRGAFGLPALTPLDAQQLAYYRAGHAHAGVLLILALFLQLAIDHARLGRWAWPIRISAPLAAVLVSGGFFAIAHVAALSMILYVGVALVSASTLAVGVGLLKKR
jgi:hypothetical protein